ncbi:phospholipase D-like domain-containing protein [Mycobacterium sp. SMC-21]|uniref:phospholipase D-like domain-containing protein n=1 Tax=Mycobacterium sp. SMC-21 TaxID=3381632 RepID=UPI003876B44C
MTDGTTHPTITTRDQPLKNLTRAALAAVTITVAGCSHLPIPGLTGSSTTGITDGPYTLIQEPQAGYSTISSHIDGAKKSVRVVIYELADDAIEKSLENAKTRGDDVKVLLDSAFHGQQVNQPAYTRLRAAGVDVKWAPARTIVHQKSVVIDDDTAIISTANFDAKYYPTGRDAMIVSTVPEQVSAVAATFDADYAVTDTGRLSQAIAAPGLIWSPAARAEYIRTINAAHDVLNVTSEELKDHAAAISIAQAARRGVPCKIVLNADDADTPAVTQVKDAGCAVRVLPKSPNALYMHEKIVLTDDSLIIGSQNLSTKSLTENRELSIRLDKAAAPNIVAAVHNQFAADFDKATPA